MRALFVALIALCLIVIEAPALYAGHSFRPRRALVGCLRALSLIRARSIAGLWPSSETNALKREAKRRMALSVEARFLEEITGVFDLNGPLVSYGVPDDAKVDLFSRKVIHEELNLIPQNAQTPSDRNDLEAVFEQQSRAHFGYDPTSETALDRPPIHMRPRERLLIQLLGYLNQRKSASVLQADRWQAKRAQLATAEQEFAREHQLETLPEAELLAVLDQLVKSRLNYDPLLAPKEPTATGNGQTDTRPKQTRRRKRKENKTPNNESPGSAATSTGMQLQITIKGPDISSAKVRKLIGGDPTFIRHYEEFLGLLRKHGHLALRDLPEGKSFHVKPLNSDLHKENEWSARMSWQGRILFEVHETDEGFHYTITELFFKDQWVY